MARIRFGRAGFRRRGELGQAVVEMALIVPLFLLICLGILDFGRAFYNYERIQNAAREGAAWLALRPTAGTPAVQLRVQSEGIACSDGPVQVTGATVINNEAIVTVTCGFDLVTPFMGVVLGPNPITLTGRAQMPVVRAGA